MAKRIIDREKVGELFNQGMTCSEIAKEVGCGAPAVSEILKTMRGGADKSAPIVIADARLLYLWQLLYDRLWELKAEGFPGAPKKVVLQRLKSLIGVINA